MRNKENQCLIVKLLKKLNLYDKNYLYEKYLKQVNKNDCYFDHKMWKLWSLSLWLEKKF